jgi:hypothetical protein
MFCVCAPLDHKYVDPVFAVNTTLPPWQNVVAPPAVIDAVVPPFTFTIADVALVHPFTFVTVYIMVVAPAVKPVTNPEAETDATAALLDVHVPPVVDDANCVVKPEQTFVAPVIDAGVGNAFTVTVAVAVLVQLFEFVYVYVIVAVPALTPVTDPVDELTIAVAVLELDHVPPD